MTVDPGYWSALAWRARVRLQTGQVDEARRDAELALRLSGEESVHALTALAMAVARAGDSIAALSLVERTLGASDIPATSARFAAMALVGLDDDRAMRLLESIRPRGVLLRATLRMPEFDPLRSNSRFQTLLEIREN